MFESVGRKGIDMVRRGIAMHAGHVLGNQSLNLGSGKVVDAQFDAHDDQTPLNCDTTWFSSAARRDSSLAAPVDWPTETAV